MKNEEKIAEILTFEGENGEIVPAVRLIMNKSYMHNPMLTAAHCMSFINAMKDSGVESGREEEYKVMCIQLLIEMMDDKYAFSKPSDEK